MVGLTNPLLADPSRTGMIRKQFCQSMTKVFRELSREVSEYLVSPEQVLNAAKIPEISQAKIDNFEQWIISRMTEVFDAKGKKWGKDTDWWAEYIEWSFRQGAGKTFDEVRKKHSAKNQRKPDWYNGTRDQFLSSAFNNPVTKERLKVLVGRTYKDIKGLTTHAAQILTQTLTDGMIQGRSIKSLAADLQKKLDISKGRAFTIARTEVIRAHAEGQLSALEAMGIEDVSVNVEWQTAGDKRVCPKCRSLGNKVFKVKDAHGIIPVHPNCRCAFIPAFTKPDMTASKARSRIASVITASKKRSS